MWSARLLVSCSWREVITDDGSRSVRAVDIVEVSLTRAGYHSRHQDRAREASWEWESKKITAKLRWAHGDKQEPACTESTGSDRRSYQRDLAPCIPPPVPRPIHQHRQNMSQSLRLLPEVSVTGGMRRKWTRCQKFMLFSHAVVVNDFFVTFSSIARTFCCSGGCSRWWTRPVAPSLSNWPIMKVSSRSLLRVHSMNYPGLSLSWPGLLRCRFARLLSHHSIPPSPLYSFLTTLFLSHHSNPPSPRYSTLTTLYSTLTTLYSSLTTLFHSHYTLFLSHHSIPLSLQSIPLSPLY